MSNSAESERGLKITPLICLKRGGALPVIHGSPKNIFPCMVTVLAEWVQKSELKQREF